MRCKPLEVKQEAQKKHQDWKETPNQTEKKIKAKYGTSIKSGKL